ncbi:tRNA 5-methoxyuridine(34)/uridine 5-oxyacetic acid(34) synthase CmoB [Desulfocapsa sp. AH-315-G09]|uniref:tRNA 5-methoxyuridine(34)/uridine 5-oxyacetic acid(34) synthase CmoB n=1 Tax=Desulfotalea psychrophila TaxID=84980 RepID=A0ABS3AU56_9BACT|nr:tRNA 5-methoxyuridine(34)/uridine 5-oxyacetic acid(34) synthase CmoB [Desulfocapsa sp.]MBN4045919.1 tRNA 5-methoxyuridine(34)/uridine 5-oxyacetic acid(34) synthase CmoB [bacterium AH-315-P11]MBN4048633.1 tRNA 5-methoxyuridine(34)/uridine 5-oxyacetic acid(34) synthase CmoB [bacterium AH-315-N22]MBN4065581.1 tRNA 5-methoxyuridine(34)/uridine 5-oxyacetic acid(34) synthase CmoB [Desulfocapsa sp. AH-315-G09]MBN4068281.1 tRNA 5-methoxyuridine(34)/uridine 5-oxyacetic acid(34) synthase CmoB [Desulfo
MNYIELLPDSARYDEIITIHKEKQKWINQDKKGFLRYRTPCEILQKFPATTVDCSGDAVTIGKPNEVSHTEQKQIDSALRDFIPWRKGPFSVFGTDIDTEWQSQRKWQRLLPKLPDLKGKVVADIGCSNGYYMFRMLPYKPELVIGFEPSVQHYYCFKGLNGMARQEKLHIDLLGVEHLPLFPECFDVLFLMGIIYHRSSPVDTLRDVFASLASGGTLVLESQAIPGASPTALFPEKTYAKVPGTYFVPTGKCLQNWLSRAGFSDIELFCQHPMSSTEQRRTDWMQFESYSDFLDPKDSTKTVEGYPAPDRVFIIARKKR